jgi:nitrogen fixation negative regulator NifL
MNVGYAKISQETPIRAVQNEAYFRSLIENASDIITILEPNGIIRYESPSIERVLGYKPEELVGCNAFEFIHPDDVGLIQEIFTEELSQDGRTTSCEFRFRHKDGSWRVFEGTGKNLLDDPAVRGVIVNSRDITGRKRMEEALRVSEQRYRGVFESMLEGFALCEIICNRDGKPCDFRYLDVNSAFEKILGVTRSQALGKTAREIFPQIEEFWIDTYGNVALTGAPAQFDNYFKALDKHFEVVAFSPKHGQFAAVFSDITERKQAEERLRLQSMALQAAANGIVITDRSGTILWVNPAFTKLTGHPAAEVIGQNPRFLKSGKHDEGFYRELWQTVTSGQVWQGDMINRRKDGSYYNEEMTITPVRGERGEVTHFIAIKQDITHRKETERSLRESEETFRSLSASSPLGIYLTDSQGRCTYVNPRCREIFGFSLMESMDYGWADFVHPDDRAVALQTWSDYAKSAEGEYSHEMRVQRRDGTIRTVHVRSAVLRSDDGLPMGFVGSIEDITIRKRAEDELRESEQSLERAMGELKAAQQQVIQQERLGALGTMASGIAHDFNNALAAILGFSELLCQRPETLADKEKTLRYLQMINTAAQDAGNVVNRLREFYRHREEGEAFTPVDLNQLVQQAISLTQPKWKTQAEAKGIAIHTVTELGTIPAVNGSAADLREALTNLIFNAVDAMPQGGTITLRTRSNNSHVILEVADTGMGMTEEVRRRCLEPFFTTKRDHGTGLGLSMVYGILQRHGGTVDIQTAPRRGTTFILSLPVNVESQGVAEADSAPPAMRPLRVLLVDDQDTVRQILCEYLVGDGHTVTTATNGSEGLEKFQGAEFDVVLLDRAMPGMSGDQVAAAIKQIKPGIPVILLTGFGNMMQASGEKPPGVDLVLAKPVTIAGLQSALADVVASR